MSYLSSAEFISISPQAVLGVECVVGGHTRIEANARIGNRVVIEGGSRLFSGMVVEDDVHIGFNATFVGGFSSGTSTLLRRGCQIGANATIYDGVVIGERAIVEPGAVVKNSVPPFAIVSGNPASVVDFASTFHIGDVARDVSGQTNYQAQVVESRVRGVQFYQMPFISDPRGNLTVGEFGLHLPFLPKRYFMTFQVPSVKVRGEHAHRQCTQFLVCVHGSCAVMVDDGVQREEFFLDRPTCGVLVPPMIWAVEYKHSADSALMVFASEHYDPEDYIRSYDAFVQEVKKDRNVSL